MADVLTVREKYRAKTLAMLIQESNNSGLTKREFCQQHGISEKSFYYRLRKLRGQMAGDSMPQLVPLESVLAADSILGSRTEIACRRGYRWGFGPGENRHIAPN